MNHDLVAYYRDRAREYDRLHERPERQEPLARAASVLKEIFNGRTVLEIACGTGYWTEAIAQTAASITATDINPTMLDIARHRDYPAGSVSFEQADFNSYAPYKNHDSLFGGFIWSHIPLQELDSFLQRMNSLVEPGSVLAFIDNVYVEGSNTPIADTDEEGNTYQIRKLDDNSTHRVLKNFPSHKFIIDTLQKAGRDAEYIELPYYWIASYTSSR